MTTAATHSRTCSGTAKAVTMVDITLAMVRVAARLAVAAVVISSVTGVNCAEVAGVAVAACSATVT